MSDDGTGSPGEGSAPGECLAPGLAPRRRARLSPAQERIWTAQRLDPEAPLFHMAFAFVVEAEIPPETFRRAWQHTASAATVLRARVVEEDGGRVRTVAGLLPETHVVDFRGRAEPERSFLDWARERCRRPPALDGPLVDSVLAVLGDGRTGWMLNQHHVVTDAASTGLVVRALDDVLRALLDGREPPTVTFPPYPETVAALRHRFGETGRATSEAHWRLRRGSRRPVAFYGSPTRPRSTPSVRTTIELDAERARAIEALAGKAPFRSLSPDLSRFALWSTVVAAWTHRISGAEEVGFDAPVAGRPSPEARRCPGLFIELFPFAARVTPDDTFRTLGARCLEEALLLVRHARPGASADTTGAGDALADVVLNYVPTTFGSLAGAPTSVEWLHPGHGDRAHAVRVQVCDFAGSGRPRVHLDLDAEVFHDERRAAAPAHFERVLDALLADPDQCVAAADVLTDADRAAHAALHRDHRGPRAERTVLDAILARCARDLDRIALRSGDRAVAFSNLAERIDAAARVLVERGLEAGDRVAILSGRSIETVVAILGILRAGGVFVPVAPGTPDEKRRRILADSGARLAVTDRHEGDATGGIVHVPLARLSTAVPDALLSSPPGADDPAYVLYTSGSTGEPKGVVVSHGALAEYLLWAEESYVRGERLTFPLFTSLGFDLTLTSLFLPLMSGGTLLVLAESAGPVDAAVLDLVREPAIDVVKLTPSHLAVLRRRGLENSGIRRMIVGGEDLPTSLAAAVVSQLDGRVEITNEYGPTEAVVGCVAHLFDPRVDTGPSVPIGRPAPHVEVAITNEAGARVPRGVTGELRVSGPALADGYLGRPERTAERFVTDGHGRRWYRTGDLVRLGDRGGLEFLGRIDRQLKVSGLRTEPGEIEAILREVPGVDECAVVGVRRTAGATPTPTPAPEAAIRHCVRCGLASNVPRTRYDDEGVCNVCRSYERVEPWTRDYFGSLDDLREIFDDARRRRPEAPAEALVLLSGGKDSTYALLRLVETGVRVAAFTLDNGFLSEGALANIRRVTDELGVPVHVATTPAMNAVFRDSLERFSNVCNGCFKTIYTLALRHAHEQGIPIVVTGLSRGQMFETRLTEEMFRDGRRTPEEIDAAVLAARKAYHRIPDAVSRSLDVSHFADERIFDEVRIVDFYRYCDVDMDTLYAALRERLPWIRPGDTGRSTNCLVNDVGIAVHRRERGFHNYAIPYAWDVRMGHKTREEALEELDDDLDPERIDAMLAEIGWTEESAGESERTSLEAWIVASDEVSETDLRRALSRRLPAPLIPARFHRVADLPLTPSGKVDEAALQRAATTAPERRRETRPLEGPVQEMLAEIWSDLLGVGSVGPDDGFFELGGTSLLALRSVLRLGEELDLELPLDAVFTSPRLEDLARVAEDLLLAELDEAEADEAPQGPDAGGSTPPLG